MAAEPAEPLVGSAKLASLPSPTDLTDLYERMVRIREFEEQVRVLFKQGRMPGTLHLYAGQEAVAVGACTVLDDSDRISSTHRGHGHLIAKGADVNRMMAELFGRRTGYCKGKGGSMHIVDFSLGILGANGVVGAGLPIATGAALADHLLDRKSVTIAFFGDGAANQGVFFESLNLSALWRLPVVYLCENNQYTEWMPVEKVLAGVIAHRATPFGIPSVRVDGNDVLAVRDAVEVAVERARGGDGPTLIEALTYRFYGHNEGEEAYMWYWPYRPEDEIARWRLRDPISSYRAYLTAEHGVEEAALDDITEIERQRIKNAIQFAEDSPLPNAEEAFEDLFS